MTPVIPRHFAWLAWHNLTSIFVLRGRRGAISHPRLFCVAGVGQSHTHTISFHIPSCFVTHRLAHSALSHTTVLTSQSFTTSFVFPSFTVPATTFESHYWKKLTRGVIWSFNFKRLYQSEENLGDTTFQ